MKLKTIMFSILLASNAYAGYDQASTVVCKNSEWKLKISREGSFFGKNWITLKHNGNVVVSESYDQDWSPQGGSQIEIMAKNELPCSNKDFYQLLVSNSALILESSAGGTSCEDIGEKDTTYVQLLNSYQIIKFDIATECIRKTGL